LVCAGTDAGIPGRAAAMLDGPALRTVVTDDVAGAETASAFKNVVAVAVGLCEGFSERFPERAAGHAFANARAALFAQGLRDMTRLAISQGGRAATVLGPVGTGDLFVTCLGGRNGRFGRRLGSGESAEEALRLAGSTVEGVPNCTAALALAERAGIELPIARVVDKALSGALEGPRGADEIAELVLHGLSEGLRLTDE
jgi:glycerol-3-phosphate dehydrogenase (NAD(P)+)